MATIKVKLVRGPQGLGVRVQSLEGIPGVSIAEIIPEGAAAQQGELKAGDQIVAIDGTDCKNANHQDVIDLLTGKQEVEIHVQRDIRRVVLHRGETGLGIRIQSEDNVKGVRIVEILENGPAKDVEGLYVGDVLVSVNGANVLEEEHQQVIDRLVAQEEVILEVKTPEPEGDIRYVTIVKGASGLGLKISSGEGISGVQVSDITPGSAAEQTGQVFVGDTIASVNGQNMRNANHDDVVAALTENNEIKLGLIAGKLDESTLPAAPVSEAATDITDEGVTDKRDVIIAREEEGFGLEVATLTDADGVYVRKVIPDSPAAKNNQIFANDRILAVNGKPTANASHDEVVQLLTGEDEVELVVGKANNGIDAKLASAFPEAESSTAAAAGVAAAAASATVAGAAAAAAASSEAEDVDESVADKLAAAINEVLPTSTGRENGKAPETQPISPAGKSATPKPDGVRIISLDKGDKGLGLQVTNYAEKPGVYVDNVFEGSAASESGQIFKGDQIVSVNGEATDDADFETVIGLLKEKSTVALGVKSSGDSGTLGVNVQREYTNAPPSTIQPADVESDVKNVHLKKNDKGYGMQIISAEDVTYPVIEAIIPGTVAESSELAAGDSILSINGEDLASKSHEEAIQMLMSNDEIDLVASASTEPPVNVIAPSEEAHKDAESSSASRVVHLSNTGKGFGMKIATVEGLEGVHVTEVLPNGPAAESKEVFVNDRILAANGNDLRTASHEDVIKVLTSNKEIDLELEKNNDVNVAAIVETEGGERTVHLSNTGKGFGMKIATVEGVEGVYVTEVLPNGAAAENKNVFVNDRILAVNGNDVTNSSHEDVIGILTSNKEIDLQLGKNDANVAAIVENEGAAVQEERFVHLSNKGKGFGMKIATVEGLDGVHVTEVLPDGPAAESKQVFVNDKILSVNGTDLSNASHDEVISALTSNKEIDVKLKKNADVNVAAIVEKEGSTPTDARPLDADTNKRIVHLSNQGKGFGMRIATVEGLDGIHITEVLPNGPAAESKEIFVNDRIVSANGTDLKTASHEDVINILKANKEIDLELEKNEDVNVAAIVEHEAAAAAAAADVPATESSGAKVSGKRTVHLVKGDAGFGLRLASNANEDLHVAEVIPGGAAAATSQIYPNDKILSINGEDLTHASHETAIRKLVEAKEVDLELLHAAEATETDATKAEGVRRVHLEKAGGGYGMEVSKVSDHDGFHITKIISGGVADSSKEVFVNDLIVAINGQSINSRPHEEVIGMLVAGNEVDLDLKKDEVVDAVALTRKTAPTRNVKLTKSAKGFGMKIATLNFLEGVHVVEVIPGGAAAESGEVKPNDKILSINGTNVRDSEASQVIALLSANKEVELELQANDDIDVVAAIEEDRKLGEATQEATSKAGPTEDSGKRIAHLKKAPTGYGMRIATIEGYPGVRVTEVIAGGPAEQSGKVFPNDTILSINGVDTSKSDSTAVSKLLQPTEVAIELVKSTDVDAVAITKNAAVAEASAPVAQATTEVASRSAPEFKVPEKQSPEHPIRKVKLEKGDEGYGLRIASIDGHEGVYITEVIEGGAAAATDELFPNDAIVGINGKDLRYASHKDVIEELMKSNEVEMEVQKSDKVDVSRLNEVQAYETTLARGSDGLGLRICSDAVENTIRVFEIIPDGVAAKDGKISVGDQILSVNGTPIVDANHEDTVKLFSKSDEVNLVLCPNSNPLPAVEDEKSLRKVTLKSPEEGGLGIRLMTQNNGTTIVLGVVEGSPAEKSGELQKGDQIVKVNGEALSGDYDSVATAFNASPNSEIELLVADATAASTELAKNVAAIEDEKDAAPAATAQEEETSEIKAAATTEEKPVSTPEVASRTITAASTDTPSDDTRHVIVERGPEGLGMTIVSFDVVEDHADVQDVFEGKPAHGKLKPGDQLLEINDVKLDGLKHAELLNLLKKDQTLDFLVRSPGTTTATAATTQAARSAPQPSSRRRVVLKKGPNQALGMKIITNEGRPGVKILELLPGGSALASGKIFPGDQIVEVNGQDMRQAYHDDCVLALKTKKDIELVLEASQEGQNDQTAPVPRSAQPAASNIEKVRQVTLSRGSAGLGLTIISDEDVPGVRVQSVIDNSPASATGKVFPNDMLVAINGVHTYNSLHAEVLQLLKAKPDVTLLLAQPQDVREAILSLGPEDSGTVTLARKGTQPLGVLVATDESGALRVSSFSPNSIAARSSKVNVGDEITVINGASVSGKSSQEVVEMFSSPGDITLIVRESSAALPILDQSTIITGTGDIRTVQLNKTVAGLGIRIETDEGDTGAKVATVIDGGAAAQSGKVYPGDHILAVDGVPMHDKAHQDVVGALGNKEKEELTLLLRSLPEVEQEEEEKPQPVQKEEQPNEVEAVRSAMAAALADPKPVSIRPDSGNTNGMELDQVRTVIIQRSGKSLGFKVVDRDGNQVITDLTEGGAAEATGQVFVDDIIVSVNGQTMRNKSHDECVTALTSSDECKLVLKQPPKEEHKKKKGGLFSCCC